MDGSGHPVTPRDPGGRFSAGNPGRRVGSRNRVSKRVALAILDDFEANQGDLLARTRRCWEPGRGKRSRSLR